MATILRAAREIEYPESDGKPMAETDVHRKVMTDLIDRLIARYAHRDDMYVSGNLLVYYFEGKPEKCLAPDCFVVFGVPAGDRRTYKTWEEGKFPDVVFEITSKKTKKEEKLKDKAERKAGTGQEGVEEQHDGSVAAAPAEGQPAP